MKITSHVNGPEQPKPDTGKALNKAQRADAQTTESEAAPGAPQGRDFASVLEEVSRESERREEHGKDEEPAESKRTERAGEHERLVQKREERREGEGSGGGFGSRGGVTETTLQTEATGARAILHIADLEKIVAAVRTQMLGGGRNEVTLELHRSVLEGLRIRLTRDGQGRITAEFIAATERVRAQVDARSQELAELLRSRGLNLASLSARTEADAGGSHNAGGDAQRDSFERLSGLAGAGEAGSTATESAHVEASERVADEDGSTYRA